MKVLILVVEYLLSAYEVCTIIFIQSETYKAQTPIHSFSFLNFVDVAGK